MGATVVRVSIPDLETLTGNLSLMSLEFQPTFNRYLASLGANAPVKTFEEFMARGEFHPSLRNILEGYQRIPDGLDRPEYQQQLRRRANLRQALMTAIAANRLDAILYPHQRRLVVPTRRRTGGTQRRVVEQHRIPGVDVFPAAFHLPPRTRPSACPSDSSCSGPSGANPRS